MSAFSAKLNTLIQERNARVMDLARFLGMDRSTLYKILNGKRRFSDAAQIDALAAYFMLSPEDVSALKSAYEIDLIGPRLYNQRLQVHDFFEHFGSDLLDDSRSCSIPNPLSTTALVPEQGFELLKGKSQLEAALSLLLLQESGQKHPKIQMQLQPMDPAILSLVRSIASYQPSTRLEHVFLLEEGAQVDKGGTMANLETFKSVLPFYTSAFDYCGFPLYSTLSNLPKYLAIWPDVVITRSGVLFLNQTSHTGYIIYGREEAAYFAAQFEKVKLSTRQMLWKTENFYELLQDLADNYNDSDVLSYDFQMFPCLTYWLSDAMIARLVRHDLPHREVLIQAFTDYKNRQKAQRAISSTAYITSLEGIDFFLKTGILCEYPPALTETAQPADRAAIIENMLRDFPHNTFRFLKQPIGSLQFGMAIYVGPHFGYITLTRPGTHFYYLRLEDPSILAMFRDYIASLPDALFVENDAAIQEIQSMVDHYKAAEKLV